MGARHKQFAVMMEERWGFLAPWCAALKGRFSYSAPSEEGELWDTRKRFLRVYLPTRRRLEEEDYELTAEQEAAFQKKFRLVHEALALLSAVAHVDHDAWRYLLEEHCGAASTLGPPTEAAYADKIAPRFVLMMHTKAEPSWKDGNSFSSDLVQLCGTSLYKSPSKGYVDALETIAALHGNSAADGRGRDIAIPVKVSFRASSDTGTYHSLMSDIWKGEQAIRDEWRACINPPSGSLRCKFVLEPMRANVAHVSPEMVHLLEKLAVNDVRFSQLCLQVWMGYEVKGGDKREAKKLFATFITRVFNVRRPLPSLDYYFDSADRDKQPLRVGAAHVDCRGCRSSRFEALCSALVVNQTTKRLSVKLKMVPKFCQPDPIKTRRRWKWIAYAFFSKRARTSSSLESLALMRITSMTDEDMEGFAAVLNSEHPEEELFDRPRPLVASRGCTLTAGSPIRWKFDDRGGPVLSWDALTFDFPIRFVRTFSDDGASGWVDVIVPGIGRGQVRREHLAFESPCSAVKQRSGVTSLQIGFAEDDGDTWPGLLAFLAAVGSPLRFLGFDYFEGELEDVLRLCPNLQEMTFIYRLAVLRLNFTEYAGNGEDLDYGWDDAEELAEALSAKTNALSKCLRRLRVSLKYRWAYDENHEREYGPYIETEAKALLAMLEVNRSLEFLDVQLPESFHEFADDFRKHHLSPLARPLRPLPTQSKLALLSVLSERERSPQKSTTKRTDASPGALLSQDVLAKIFAFAASPVLRQVFVRNRKVLSEHNWSSSPYEGEVI
jgi:hypothetical protein